MSNKIKLVMLVDDNPDDNFFHEREIKKINSNAEILKMNSGIEALEYLESCKENKDLLPNIIFLDINMPRMNGWEFLQKYSQLVKEMQSELLIIMLTTSEDPTNIVKAKSSNIVSDYITKPLTKEIMESINHKYFEKEQ